MKATYIIDAVRTPVGRYGGILSSVRPDDLMAITIKGILDRNTSLDINTIDGVIVGDGNQAGEDCRNVARMAALLAGLPFSVPGNTVNCLCGSGMQALIDASRAIQCGDGQLYIAGGVESMSRAPLVRYNTEKEYLPLASEFDSTIGWRFTNHKLAASFQPLSMGETAELVAKKYEVGRFEQDAFSLASHEKYFDALAKNKWADEIIPVPVTNTKGVVQVIKDEQPRQLTFAQLQRLKTLFDTSEEGTVTAGNSSGINDGAAALMLANQSMLKSLSLKPKARIVASTIVGVHPDEMGLGPVFAINKLLKKTGLHIQHIDLFEISEAFAATSIVCMNQLGLDGLNVNVNGGSIALGHPIGSTGARIITTLVHEMARTKKRFGIASICVGLGQGLAVLIENLDL